MDHSSIFLNKIISIIDFTQSIGLMGQVLSVIKNNVQDYLTTQGIGINIKKDSTLSS